MCEQLYCPVLVQSCGSVRVAILLIQNCIDLKSCRKDETISGPSYSRGPVASWEQRVFMWPSTSFLNGRQKLKLTVRLFRQL
ncbi:hypothetical protein RRG08_005572 [Elysia crispata]|uniref:Uncharacterized protein n=1 Tax=Elysia crispata TaxID=231223 RepID=A0AAE1B2X9_9GAST|nr:hypothetical protein RRG08_005572 [Elysia crispata]